MQNANNTKIKRLALFVLLCILVLVILLPFNLGIFIALLAVTIGIAVWAIRSLSVELTSSKNNRDLTALKRMAKGECNTIKKG